MLFLVIAATRYFIRIPSYTIKTGKLYIVSKLVETLRFFLIYTWKEIVEIPIIDIESHQTPTLVGQN
jgi:hypothetical protein